MDNNTRWQEFNSIIDNDELPHDEKLLLLIIFRFVNSDSGKSYPSIETLKKLYGTKRNETIFSKLKNLYGKGYLIKKQGVQNRNEYTIVFPKSGQCTNIVSSSEKCNKVFPKSGRKVCPKNGRQKENIKENKKIYIDLTFIDDVIDKVKLTQEQYNKLVDKFSNEFVSNQILALDNYIANGKGTKYKDHYRALNTWCNNKKPKQEISIKKSTITNFDEE
ncbi:helix-turn-helix domain-containing protein [Clostridium saccharoperbutylacetonicum]|uniref:helix-turn-helix domain-containing protein n=1 Tax=Clostridium saccharoperbutylacetonicum TaxID=36745 RepID=UPI0039EC8151